MPATPDEALELTEEQLTVIARIADFDRIDKTFRQKVAKILLYLAVAHIDAVHNLCFSSAIFADFEHFGDDFYI